MHSFRMICTDEYLCIYTPVFLLSSICLVCLYVSICIGMRIVTYVRMHRPK